MTGPVFAQLPVEVFRYARLSARDLRILGLLYAFANREGRCWPSRRQLAALSGLPLGRLSTTTTRLAAFGWLTKTGNGGRSRACRYQL
jgi:DNA-binding IclR family transcriptional regulator